MDDTDTHDRNSDGWSLAGLLAADPAWRGNARPGPPGRIRGLKLFCHNQSSCCAWIHPGCSCSACAIAACCHGGMLQDPAAWIGTSGLDPSLASLDRLDDQP
jgi:hypothetical protein